MSALEAMFAVVVDTSWRATCLILVAFGLRHWVRGRVAARVVFGVWLAVAFRLLLPVSLPTAWSPFNLAPWREGTGEAPRAGAEGGMTLGEAKISGAAIEGPRVESAGSPSLLARLSWIEWATLVWASGVVVLLGARGAAYGRFGHAVKRTAVPVARDALPAEVASSLERRGVEVSICAAVSAPALVGVFRPRILFPPGLIEQLTPSEIRLTVAHEMAHVERRDLLADAVLHLAAVVHWFNPFAWLAVRAARNDCELACDERVLRRVSESDRAGYGETLLRIVRLTTNGPWPRYGLGVVTSKREIKRRLHMILSNPVFPRAHMLVWAVVFAGITGLSFTSETTAQVKSAPALGQPASGAAATESAGGDGSGIVYNPTVDRLDHLFPTGVVATVNDRTVTVAEVRRFVGPLIPRLQSTVRSQEEFNERLMLVQNSAIKDLVNRAVLIRQFHDRREGEQGKQIPAEYVDNSIAGEIRERFDVDREKFLDHLRGRGLTLADYRREVEENIIYQYMRSQERKLAGKPEPKAEAKAEAAEKSIRLRIIQLNRGGEGDAVLLEKANAILAWFRGGESFEQLAREFDQGARRGRGGDWGWVGASDVKPQFWEMLAPLQKGQVSAPVLLPEGCFLLYVDERR